VSGCSCAHQAMYIPLHAVVDLHTKQTRGGGVVASPPAARRSLGPREEGRRAHMARAAGRRARAPKMRDLDRYR
jgi:hypothetical protein